MPVVPAASRGEAPGRKGEQHSKLSWFGLKFFSRLIDPHGKEQPVEAQGAPLTAKWAQQEKREDEKIEKSPAP